MKKTYNIDVDCAVCADKLEQALSKREDVNEVRINFMTKKLKIDTDLTLDQLQNIAEKIDKDIEIR